jgi:hypothetical protein
MTKAFLEGTTEEIEAINVTLYGLPIRGIPQDDIAAASIDDATGVGWTLQHDTVWYASENDECAEVTMEDLPDDKKIKTKDTKKAKYDKIKEPKVKDK